MSKEFVTFIAAGVLNTFVGLGAIFLLLNIIGLDYWLSTFLGNGLGAITSYFLNKNFTFKYNLSSKYTFIKFSFVIIGCYWVSFLLGKELVSNYFKVISCKSLALSKDNLAVLISMIIYNLSNFLGQKFLVFKK